MQHLLVKTAVDPASEAWDEQMVNGGAEGGMEKERGADPPLLLVNLKRKQTGRVSGVKGQQDEVYSMHV